MAVSGIAYMHSLRLFCPEIVSFHLNKSYLAKTEGGGGLPLLVFLPVNWLQNPGLLERGGWVLFCWLPWIMCFGDLKSSDGMESVLQVQSTLLFLISPSRDLIAALQKSKTRECNN